MTSKGNSLTGRKVWDIHTTLVFMITCGRFFLVSSHSALDWWACVFSQIVCLPHLLFWSWAEKQASYSDQFSFKCAYVAELASGTDNKQIHRALEDIQLCKRHKRISRENLKVCRFLGSVLIVSNSIFSDNLEWLHGQAVPFLVGSLHPADAEVSPEIK